MTLLPLLIACGSPLSEEDSQAAFGAMNTVSTDVQTQAFTGMSTAQQSLDVTADGDTYTFDGQLDGGVGWTGTVLVSGSSSMSGIQDYSYDFFLEYIDVDVSGLILNGTMDWAMTSQGGSGGAYSYAYEMVGDMDVSGSASGTLGFDYSLSLSVDPMTGAYTYEASGDINGYDVSEWSTGGY